MYSSVNNDGYDIVENGNIHVYLTDKNGDRHLLDNSLVGYQRENIEFQKENHIGSFSIYANKKPKLSKNAMYKLNKLKR